MELERAVELAKKQDNEGIAFLYQNTYQKSYYMALKYVKNEDLAQDVVQESYIKAFKNIDKLDDANKFEAWIGRIVARTAIDELRKKNPMLFSETENEEGQTIEETFEDDRVEVQPEVSMDKKETTRLVQEMMADLSDEQRVCITMFYMEELSIKDIAASLEVSENTVKSRLNYGRQKIKDKVLTLEKQGIKLYGIAPIPFFIWLLSTDAEACSVAVPAISAVAGVAGGATAAAGTGGAAATGGTAATAGGATAASTGATAAVGAGKVAATAISAKTIIAGTAAVVVIGGAATGVAIANNSDSDKQAETVESETEVVQEDAAADVSVAKFLETSGIAVGDNVVYYPSDSYHDEDAHVIYKMDLTTQEKTVFLSGMDYHEAALYGNDLYTVESEIEYGDAGWDEDEGPSEPATDTPLKIIRYDLETMEREQIGSGNELLIVGDKMYAYAYKLNGQSFGGEKVVSMDLNTDEVEVLADVKTDEQLGIDPEDYSTNYELFYYDGQVYQLYLYLQYIHFTEDMRIMDRDEGYQAYAVDGTPADPAAMGVVILRQLPDFGDLGQMSSEYADILVTSYAHTNGGWIFVDTSENRYIVNEDGTRITL